MYKMYNFAIDSLLIWDQLCTSACSISIPYNCSYRIQTIGFDDIFPLKLFNSKLTNHLLQFMAKDFCNIICFIKVYIRVCHVIQMHKGWTSNRGLLWDVLRGWEVQHYDHRGSDAVYRIPKIFNSGKGGSGEIKIGESALMIKKYKQKCIC